MVTGLVVVLRGLGAAFIAVAGLHLCLGLGADAVLGSPVTAEMMRNASFDNQNRFYGVAFSLLGVVLWIATTDMPRYRPMTLAVLGVLFGAGVARLVSVALHGLPAPAITAIMIADLVLPPIVYVWMARIGKRNAS